VLYDGLEGTFAAPSMGWCYTSSTSTPARSAL
jgi:hypothetical protein